MMNLNFNQRKHKLVLTPSKLENQISSVQFPTYSSINPNQSLERQQTQTEINKYYLVIFIINDQKPQVTKQQIPTQSKTFSCLQHETTNYSEFAVNPQKEVQDLRQRVFHLTETLEMLRANDQQKENETQTRVFQYEKHKSLVLHDNESVFQANKYQNYQQNILLLTSEIEKLTRVLKEKCEENEALKMKFTFVERQLPASEIDQKQIETMAKLEKTEILLSDLQQHHKVLEEDNISKEKQIQKNSQEINKLHEDLRKSEEKKSLNNSEVSRLKEQIYALSQKISTQMKDIEKLNKTVTYKDQKYTELEHKVFSSEIQNQQVQNDEIAKLQNVLGQFFEQNQELKTQLSHSEVQKQEFQDKVDELQQFLNEVQSQKQSLIEKQRELCQELEQNDAYSLKHQEKFARLEFQQLEKHQLQVENKSLKGVLSEKQLLINELESKSASQELSIKKTSNLLNEQETKLQILQSQKDMFESQNCQKNDQINKLSIIKINLEQKIESMQTLSHVISEFESKILQISSQKEILLQQKQDLECEIQIFRQNNQNLEQDLQDQQIIVQELEKKLSSKQERHIDLEEQQRQIEHLQTVLKKNQVIQNELQQKKQSLHFEIKTKDSILTQRVKQIEDLQDKITNLEICSGEYQLQKQTIFQLNKEIDRTYLIMKENDEEIVILKTRLTSQQYMIEQLQKISLQHVLMAALAESQQHQLQEFEQRDQFLRKNSLQRVRQQQYF